MTNMWIGLDASELCNQHLAGLHSELHQEKGCIEKHEHGKAIAQGHWKLGQVSTDQLQQRHEEVVREMERRGMTHDSPLSYSDILGYSIDLLGIPVRAVNRACLVARCSDCREKASKHKKGGED